MKSKQPYINTYIIAGVWGWLRSVDFGTKFNEMVEAPSINHNNNGGRLMKMNNLKDYIKGYQEGNKNALNQLIYMKKVTEINGYGETDPIERIAYRDKKLNHFYFELCREHKYIDNKDIEEWFFDCVVNVIFEKCDIKRDPQQIIDWASKRLRGHIKNKIEEAKIDGKFPLAESYQNTNESGGDDEAEDEELSLYDLAVYQEYAKIEDSPGYSDFINFIGGIDKILTKEQYEIFNSIQDPTKTQEELAKELGCTQENISKRVSVIHKKVKENWVYYKSMKAVGTAMKTGLYDKIKCFIDQYDLIIKFDQTDSFDYFGRIVYFLKDNYKKGEQELVIDPIVDDQLKVNKMTLHTSVFDLIADNVTKKTYINLIDILEGELDIESEFNEYTYGQRERQTIVNQIIKTFRKYLSECENSVQKASKYISSQKKLSTNNILKVS